MWLLDMFRPSKSAVTEEGVELPVPGGEAVDEIQMCERCQFKGQCKFENGCTSLRTSLLNRVRKLAKLRGTPTGDVHKAAQRIVAAGDRGGPCRSTRSTLRPVMVSMDLRTFSWQLRPTFWIGMP